MKRRQSLLLMLAAFAAPVFAAVTKRYDPATFDKLAAEGKPVVLAIHAPWCPTCKAQKVVIGELLADPKYRDLTLLTIDFDSEKALLARYKVEIQSTLIAFHGKTEVGRSVADISKDGIDKLFAKTLH